MSNKFYAVPNIQTPSTPFHIDEEKCVGCNTCLEVCQIDILMPHPKKGQPPIILHPEECWYCGCCAMDCPTGALTSNWPLPLKPRWRRKETGEVFQVID